MMFSGCIALATAGAMLCYSNGQITCADMSPPLGNIISCRQQSANFEVQMMIAKQLGICSQDGSTCSGPLPSVAVSPR